MARYTRRERWLDNQGGRDGQVHREGWIVRYVHKVKGRHEKEGRKEGDRDDRDGDKNRKEEGRQEGRREAEMGGSEGGSDREIGRERSRDMVWIHVEYLQRSLC